jgi:hypothetical protein
VLFVSGEAEAGGRAEGQLQPFGIKPLVARVPRSAGFDALKITVMPTLHFTYLDRLFSSGSLIASNCQTIASMLLSIK